MWLPTCSGAGSFTLVLCMNISERHESVPGMVKGVYTDLECITLLLLYAVDVVSLQQSSDIVHVHLEM